MKATAMRKEKSNSPPMSNQVAWARRGYIWGYAMSDRTMLVFRGANYSVPKLTKRALHWPTRHSRSCRQNVVIV
jgi:hypothetical protein